MNRVRVSQFKFDTPAGGSTNLTWLQRFDICLAAECADLFSPDWCVRVDPERRVLILQGPDRRQRLSIPFHPGSHVLAPAHAAHRYADQLHFAAVTRGFIEPAEGTASTDEQFFA